MSTQADKVRAAADYIERAGLHKGDLYDREFLQGKAPNEPGSYSDPLEDGRVVATETPCCTYGALLAFDYWEGFRLLMGFERHIGITGTSAVGPWNDAPERTKEEVVAALRSFADSLEAEETG